MTERPLRAICPSCTKALVVDGAGAGWPRHFSPGRIRVRCYPATVVRRAHLVHPCITCAALPDPAGLMTLPEGFTEWRPQHPRAIDPKSSPRLPECASHRRDRIEAQKARRRAANRVRSRGVSEDDRDELWAAQGGACICGRQLTSTGKAPTLDHDHARAKALCEHDPAKACRRCARGSLCDTCNRILVGRYSPTQLRMVARYIEHPTAELLGWWADD